MKKRIITFITILAGGIFLFSSNLVAETITSLSVSDGRIIVQNNRACVEINGNSLIINRENASYIQFEGRYIRMYNLKIEDMDGTSFIDFKGFRFIDALV